MNGDSSNLIVKLNRKNFD